MNVPAEQPREIIIRQYQDDWQWLRKVIAHLTIFSWHNSSITHLYILQDVPSRLKLLLSDEEWFFTKVVIFSHCTGCIFSSFYLQIKSLLSFPMTARVSSLKTHLRQCLSTVLYLSSPSQLHPIFSTILFYLNVHSKFKMFPFSVNIFDTSPSLTGLTQFRRVTFCYILQFVKRLLLSPTEYFLSASPYRPPTPASIFQTTAQLTRVGDSRRNRRSRPTSWPTLADFCWLSSIIVALV